MANEHMSEDEKVLHGMGYAQELHRRMGGFQNFAISFSIICILSGGFGSGDTVHVEVKLAVKKRARSSLPRMRLSS